MGIAVDESVKMKARTQLFLIGSPSADLTVTLGLSIAKHESRTSRSTPVGLLTRWADQTRRSLVRISNYIPTDSLTHFQTPGWPTFRQRPSVLKNHVRAHQ
jgi:hypothetical protein